jgi:hypothetical protein
MSGQRYVGWVRKRGGIRKYGWFAVADGHSLERVEKDTAAAVAAQAFVMAESVILPEGQHPDSLPRVPLRRPRKEI